MCTWPGPAWASSCAFCTVYMPTVTVSVAQYRQRQATSRAHVHTAAVCYMQLVLGQQLVNDSSTLLK
jgi:hypothetical protein